MKFIPAIFAAFLLLIVLLADTGHLGPLAGLYSFPHGDKAGHFILFGMGAFLIVLNVLGSRRFSESRWTPLIAAACLAFLVGLEEWSQRFFSARTSSWADLMFSYAGIALGAWAAWLIHKKRA